MSSKRPKISADKARERITTLEESIVAREQKLEQLRARIARSSAPEEKLVAAQERLERRLELEHGQLQKLRKLLGRRVEDQDSPPESSEYFSSEEIDDLHRSFEEVRQDLSQVKLRLESTEFPRDLPSRLNSFDERLSRREEVASDLYSQILNLQNSLDQERQTVRKLSRRIREQDQSLDALREAVEDSVVATVDLAERLEELEENVNGEGEGDEAEASQEMLAEEESPFTQVWQNLAALEEKLEALAVRIEESAAAPREKESADLDIAMEALNDFEFRLEGLENLTGRLEELEATLARLASEPKESERAAPLAAPVSETPQEEEISPAPVLEEPVVTEMTRVTQESAQEPIVQKPALLLPSEPQTSWTKATFRSGRSGAKLVTHWEKAHFERGPRETRPLQ